MELKRFRGGNDLNYVDVRPKPQILHGVSQTLPQTLSSTQVLFSELDADKSGTVPDLVKSRRKHSQFFFKMFDESATLIKLKVCPPCV